MRLNELWEWMMEGNYPPGYPDMDRLDLVPLERTAIATLTRDIKMEKWQGHDAFPEFLECYVPKGTKIKIVMASRMGDVGITDDLSALNGYHYRTDDDSLFENIEPIEDSRTDKVRIAFPNG